MRSTTTLLATVALLFFWQLRQTAAAEQRNLVGAVSGGDRSESVRNDTTDEFEDKILQAWIELFIDRYNKNVQPSTEKTNIQRIAKGRASTSTSTKPVPEHGNIAPLPIYPFFFNPYYHQKIYPKYIPLTYSGHLMPISQVPYSQDEYHHHFLIPVHVQYPHTHISNVISSTPMVNFPKIKKPINSQTNKPLNNLDKNPKYDKPHEISTIDVTSNISNQISNSTNHITPSLEYKGLEGHLKDDEKEYKVYETPNSMRDGKLIHNINNLPDLIPTIVSTVIPYKFNDSQKVQNLPLSTTDDTLISTSTSSNIINNAETDDITLTSMPTTIPDTSNPLEIINSSVPKLPSDIDYDSSNKFSTIVQSSSLNTEQSETTTNSNESDEISTISANTYSAELLENQYSWSLNNKETSTDILKTAIETEKKSMFKINEKLIPNNKITSLSSTETSYPKTTLFSTLQSENNDSLTSKSPNSISPSTTIQQDNSYHSPVQMRSISPTTQSTNDNIVSYNQSDLIFEVHSSTFMIPSSSPFPNNFDSTQISTHSIISLGKNNNSKSTNVHYTSPSFTFQPLNTSRVEDKTEEYLPTEINSNIKKKTTQNTNIPTSNDELITSPPTIPFTILTPKLLSPKEINALPHIKTTQNNLPSDIKISSKSTNDTPKKSINTYIKDKNDNYFSLTTYKPRETSLNSLEISVKLNNSIQRKLPEDSKHRTIINNLDHNITKTSQTIKDSELWYGHMSTQNPRKKELNDEQVNFLLKKLIRLLKPDIDKQPITKESLAKLVTQGKFVYIIAPWGRDTVQSIDNQERQEINTSR